DVSRLRMFNLEIARSSIIRLQLGPPRARLLPYTTLFRSRAATRAPRPDESRKRTPSRSTITRGPPSVSMATSRALTRGVVVDLRSEEHTSELQSLRHLVCRLLLAKKKISL